MSKFTSAFLAVCVSASLVLAAGYQVKSEWLKNPKKNIDNLLNEADFFVKSKDEVNGGFYTYVYRDGKPYTPLPPLDWFPSEQRAGWWSWPRVAPYSNMYWYLPHEEFGLHYEDGSKVLRPYNPDVWWEYETGHHGAHHDYNVKGVTPQSRLAFAYSRAFMVTGDEKYLALARHALDFLYKGGWDQWNGGWWFSTDEKGNPAPWMVWWDPNSWKWTYEQIYPLVGIAAYVDATRSDKDMQWLNRGFNVLNSKIWDSRPGLEGYYTDANLDWSNPRGKGFTPTVDGITTHALAMYLLTEDPALKTRLLTMADGIVNHMVASMDNPDVKIGFPETYNSDWQIDYSAAGGDIGHLLKTSWCLARAYMIEPKPEYKAGAKKIIYDVLNKGGYDHVNGGPYLNYNWQTGAVNQGKDYWMLEQAVTAGLLNYAIADNAADKQAFLKMADQSLDFFNAHFWDKTYGGHYYDTDNQGVVTNATKSDLFEQGYHITELCYLAYVYGNLFYKNQTVDLYYKIAPKATAQTIKLNPVEFGDANLIIQNVTLNGNGFKSFDATKRTLYLKANEGGKFCVTYKDKTPRWAN